MTGDIQINISEPTAPTAKNLTKEDVWGTFDDNHERISWGMIVAQNEQTCPIFGDVVPYKSVTVICRPNQVEEVQYWLEYVHGGGSISHATTLENGDMAIRSNYMCW